MRFTFNGSEYSISFKRETKEVTKWDGEILPSKFPYTTVTIELITLGEDGKVAQRTLVRTATVGALSTEPIFTFEKGRLAALRSISCTLDKPFKQAMWKSYTSRPRD